METLSFLRFWKPNTHKENPPVTVSNPEIIDEEDDSFFDLELSFPLKEGNPDENIKERNEIDSIDEQKRRNVSCNEGKNVSLSGSDNFSRRKIIPVEVSLKSSPKFQSFTGKKNNPNEKTELVMDASKQDKHFVRKFRMEEVLNLSTLTRETNSNRRSSFSDDSSFIDDSSRRFSKDVIQKYLKLIKPLYIKVSKRRTHKRKLFEELAMASPACSPATRPTNSPRKEKHGNIPASIRVVCKHLGKSRSASSVTGASSPVNRRDDSLLLHDNGIQSAILHCKRSFNASRDSSLLSRSTSNSSREKLSFSSSEDSFILSRFSSDSSSSERTKLAEELNN